MALDWWDQSFCKCMSINMNTQVSIFDLERLAGLRCPDGFNGDGFFGYGIVINTVIHEHII